MPMSSIPSCTIALGGLTAGARGRDGRLGTVEDVNVLNLGSLVWESRWMHVDAVSFVLRSVRACVPVRL